VRSKEEVLVEVVDAVLGEIRLPVGEAMTASRLAAVTGLPYDAGVR